MKPEQKAASSAPSKSAMPFGRANYRLMVVGLVVIFLGFFIMSLDKEEFGFGFLGLTLGPLVTMAGFLLEFWAILRKPVDR
jgi:isoprenylcysteine carboxyl methyltransferase (ICMT) family protein YpbQ